MWARLHFSDGGYHDIPEEISDWGMEDFEAKWRAVSVRVEWLRSPRGRLDRAINARPEDVIVTRCVDKS